MTGRERGTRDQLAEVADELTRLTEELGLYDDRQHTSDATCWCGPVAVGIGWAHN